MLVASSVNLVGEGGFVHYGDALGWGEMEHGFSDGEVFLPVGEAEFGFEISSLADDETDETGIGVGFEQDFADFLVGVGGFAFGDAAQDGVFGTARAIFGIFCSGGRFGRAEDFDAAAKFRKIGLPRQQRERRAPVGAFFYFSAADGAVGGNVEPNVGAVHNEKFLLGGFIFPAHASGLREIDDAGFGGAFAGAAGVAVALVERGFQSLRVMIARFERAEDRLRVARGWRRGGDDRQEHNSEHIQSLTANGRRSQAA